MVDFPTPPLELITPIIISQTFTRFIVGKQAICPASHPACQQACCPAYLPDGWPDSYQARLPACQLARQLAGRPAGHPAIRLAGQLSGRLACCLACRTASRATSQLAGRLTSWPATVLKNSTAESAACPSLTRTDPPQNPRQPLETLALAGVGE